MSVRKPYAATGWWNVAHQVIALAVEDLSLDTEHPDPRTRERNRYRKLDAVLFLFGSHHDEACFFGLEYWLLHLGVTDVEGFRIALRRKLERKLKVEPTNLQDPEVVEYGQNFLALASD